MAESNSDIASVKLRQRSNYAVQHLMAAARFSRRCGVIQNENKGKPLAGFYDEQIACVSAAVMLSVASVEANINELLSDADSLFGDLSERHAYAFVELITDLSILEKYDRVLAMKGAGPFKKGESPYQDVALLISMRNELVHFRPEWHDEQKRHDKLGRKLQYRFELSPFISEKEGVLFPQRVISHGCTQWAVEKSLEFMILFSGKIEVSNKFEKFMDSLEA